MTRSDLLESVLDFKVLFVCVLFFKKVVLHTFVIKHLVSLLATGVTYKTYLLSTARLFIF